MVSELTWHVTKPTMQATSRNWPHHVEIVNPMTENGGNCCSCNDSLTHGRESAPGFRKKSLLHAVRMYPGGPLCQMSALTSSASWRLSMASLHVIGCDVARGHAREVPRQSERGQDKYPCRVLPVHAGCVLLIVCASRSFLGFAVWS